MNLRLRANQSSSARDSPMGYSRQSHSEAETAARLLKRHNLSHLLSSHRTTIASSPDWVDKSTPYLDVQGSCGKRHRAGR